MRPFKRIGFLVAGVVLGLAGCGESGVEYGISPAKLACQGVGPGFCPIGVNRETGERTIFHEIEGLEFSWGVIQRVRISEHEVKNPPADGSSIRYVVEEVLETQHAPFDAVVDLGMNREYLTGTRASGYALIDSTPLKCGTSAVCDKLEQKMGSTEEFTLSLEYPTAAGDPLLLRDIR
ncbi:DUF4377 domain-containing protein [Hyalangium versicolor]|uniref:DUF4377 domain-containing protein n=1 Tax=Hyalangium versicolor TaxID=2861190 RepID=UPI001CC9690B|nr:DUF4377 domain-containing protein [Hyalangium versicolor]